MTNELAAYIKSFVPAISHRKYDEKWLIWFPLASGEDGFSLSWEIRGVYDSYSAAAKDLKNISA